MKALLVLLAIAAAPMTAQTVTVNPYNTDADRAAGAKMFRSHCAPCHGSKATGGTGPNLTTGMFFHGDSDTDLYRNIGSGIPGTAMPDVFFDGTQVWQLVAYVRSLSQTGAPEPAKGNAAHGRQLLVEKGCLACHLVRGEGGGNGPDLSLIGSQRSAGNLRESILQPDARVEQQYNVAKILAKDGSSYTGFLLNQDTWMVQILDFSRGLTSVPRTSFKDFGIDRTSVMPSYSGKLSDSELDDLIAFLLTLQRPPRGLP